jgi:hypothetical protein
MKNILSVRREHLGYYSTGRAFQQVSVSAFQQGQKQKDLTQRREAAKKS